MEYAAEQCQARVNSLVEALTEQGRTILTEVMMMTMIMMMMTMMKSLVESRTELGRTMLTEVVFIIATYSLMKVKRVKRSGWF